MINLGLHTKIHTKNTLLKYLKIIGDCLERGDSLL